MTGKAPLVIGLGEVLWDRFPDGDRLGGAPANFAFHAGQLGAASRVVSRIGRDADGTRMLEALRGEGVDTGDLQIDPDHATGTVQVELKQGQPTYEIVAPVAWDFLAWTSGLEQLAATVDAVSFGTLAQRNEVSRATIQKFIQQTPKSAIRLFDINLRQQFYSREVIEFGLINSTILKLNGEELVTIGELFDWTGEPPALIDRLLKIFPLRGIAVTLGERGCHLYYGSEQVHSTAPKIEVKDAVGAGDAFAAALVTGLLRGEALQAVADRANEIGAYVASQFGATPRLPQAASTL